MNLCALRGAITVAENSREAILQASGELLLALIEDNDIEPQDVIAATFSATGDLDAAYPAEAARDLGWREAGLLCLQEMAVEGALPMCLRVRVLWHTGKTQPQMRHQYLRGAAVLRPDLLPPWGD
jgi:chorismate mutase